MTRYAKPSTNYEAVKKRLWRAGVRKGYASGAWSESPCAVRKRRYRLKVARRALVRLLALEHQPRDVD